MRTLYYVQTRKRVFGSIPLTSSGVAQLSPISATFVASIIEPEPQLRALKTGISLNNGCD